MVLSNKPPASTVSTSVNVDAAASTASNSPVSSGALANRKRKTLSISETNMSSSSKRQATMKTQKKSVAEKPKKDAVAANAQKKITGHRKSQGNGTANTRQTENGITFS